MDLKGIVLTLVAIGAAFFFLSGNSTMQLGGIGGGLFDGSTMTSIGGESVSRSELPKQVHQANGDRQSISRFVEGFSAASTVGMPSELALLPKPAGCTVTKPTADQRLVNIQVMESDVRTRLYSYGNAEFARSAAYELDRLFSRGHETIAKTKKLKLGPMVDYGLEMVNVIVPPSEAPVYLVLQTEGTDMLWNILPMPGATVGHVTLLGNNRGGVANLPDGAGLDIPDIRSGACGAFRRAVENPLLTEGRGFRPTDETRAAYINFYGWYLESFGKAPTDGVIRVERAAGILAGDVPAETAPKAVWRSVEGQKVQILPQDNLYAVEEKAHEDWFTQKSTALVLSAFGAPEGSDLLAAITPVTQGSTN